MTAIDDRVIGIFENLEVPEGYKAELIRGEIVMMAKPDRVHNWIVEAIQDQIPRLRWHRSVTQDINLPGLTSEPQPDLVVYERDAVEGPGRLVPAPLLTLVVEVVSKTSVLRDYRTKRELYAEGTIPVYLIVDPIKAVCVLLTEPSRASASGLPDYVSERTTKFGEPVPLDLLGITLDTSEFQTYA
ncbi:Uma2 family endonuclease [Kitasatospora aureofaciens]|uniref:Uma2 family endonuclease n=1 Tax=Kitasatospora aureofaciens TaxID=1894 RepID=UPI001C440BB8|nr:Uma2 family endonuclease [Kitasatospora aureofaciens]MBV6702524.1 Uma2 family endonuclease [Kitasatospora aureofaciens]